jgi:hypothetical protein
VKLLCALIVSASVTCLAGCGADSGWGFTLPAGNAEVGEALFTSLECHSCHVVSGNSDIGQPDNPQLSIPVGGSVARIKTYGELVTSVINPSHRLPQRIPEGAITEAGQSAMKNYNEVLTVQQLIDLVAFLQAQYELKHFTPSIYPHYSHP